MKLQEIFESLAFSELKTRALDLLMSIQMNKVSSVSTSSVLEYFEKNGLEISLEELKDILGEIPFIYDYNSETIWFEKEEQKKALPQIDEPEEAEKDVAKTAMDIAMKGIEDDS